VSRNAASRNRRPVLHPPPGATPSQVDQLLDFSELWKAILSSNLQHGIAVFRGLAKLENGRRHPRSHFQWNSMTR